MALEDIRNQLAYEMNALGIGLPELKLHNLLVHCKLPTRPCILLPHSPILLDWTASGLLKPPLGSPLHAL